MKPKEIMTPLQSDQAYLLDVEHELADAHDRIRLLIAERDTARLQADQRVSLREEFRELLGTDDIEQGIAVVCDLKQLAAVRLAYIQQLEEQLMDAKNKHAALVADVALYEDRGERIKRLEEWKESAMAVEREWNPNSLSKMLGGQLGESQRVVIMREVPKLQDRIKRLEEAENRMLNWLTEDCPESVKKQLSNAWMKSKEAKP
jgi:hypothetical protein